MVCATHTPVPAPQVQGLMWLPGGVIVAVAHVDGKEGGGSPQLLLYPQYHLDNASLLARLPLKQVRWVVGLVADREQQAGRRRGIPRGGGPQGMHTFCTVLCLACSPAEAPQQP